MKYFSLALLLASSAPNIATADFAYLRAATCTGKMDVAPVTLSLMADLQAIHCYKRPLPTSAFYVIQYDDGDRNLDSGFVGILSADGKTVSSRDRTTTLTFSNNIKDDQNTQATAVLRFVEDHGRSETYTFQCKTIPLEEDCGRSR